MGKVPSHLHIQWHGVYYIWGSVSDINILAKSIQGSNYVYVRTYMKDLLYKVVYGALVFQTNFCYKSTW